MLIQTFYSEKFGLNSEKFKNPENHQNENQSGRMYEKLDRSCFQKDCDRNVSIYLFHLLFF